MTSSEERFPDVCQLHTGFPHTEVDLERHDSTQEGVSLEQKVRHVGLAAVNSHRLVHPSNLVILNVILDGLLHASQNLIMLLRSRRVRPSAGPNEMSIEGSCAESSGVAQFLKATIFALIKDAGNVQEYR